MGTPQCNYHKKIDKWRDFEEDIAEFHKDRQKYKGISPREENYSFVYRWKGKEKKTAKRLADIYEFKINWELEHDQNTPKQ